jgi:hypothetical protein
MDGILPFLTPFLFPLFFVAMWLFVTWLIGKISGWHALAARFPDKRETPLKQMTWRSGRMGSLGARINRVLNIDVCPSGLRFSLMWLFANTNKPFLVPWDQIQTENVDGVFVNETHLKFGRPQTGTMTVWRSLADEIAAAAPQGKWRS